jgi:hypothetical protein
LSFWHDLQNGYDVVDIYIANPCSIFEKYLLWGDLNWCCCGEWVSNIYLLDKRLSMFPTGVLCETSLSVGCVRSAFRLRLFYDCGSGKFVDSSFSLVDDLRVDSRYVYGDDSAFHPSVFGLIDFTRRCYLDDSWNGGAISNRFMAGCSEKEILHRKMISFWMETFKKCLVSYFVSAGVSAFYKRVSIPSLESLQDDVCVVGSYCYGLNVDSSCFTLLCTSPLRRRVDFMNLALLYWRLKEGVAFDDIVAKWVLDLERIDYLSKKVSKLSSQIVLLSLFDSGNVPEIVTGVVCDVVTSAGLSNDDFGRISLYLPAYRIYSLCKLRDSVLASVVVGNEYNFRLYYFARENELKRKVCVELVLP